MKVEPASGVVVYFASTTSRSGKIPVQDELFPTTGALTYKDVTFYGDSLTFTDERPWQTWSARRRMLRHRSLWPRCCCGYPSVGELFWLVLVSSWRAGGDRGALQPDLKETAGH